MTRNPIEMGRPAATAVIARRVVTSSTGRGDRKLSFRLSYDSWHEHYKEPTNAPSADARKYTITALRHISTRYVYCQTAVHNMKSSITYSVLGILALAGNIAAASRLQRRQAAPIVSQPVTASHASGTTWTWNAGGSNAWPIHESCNATEKALLTRGLDEAATLASHAKDHVLRYGNSSEFYQKYFGTAATGEVIGWYALLYEARKV